MKAGAKLYFIILVIAGAFACNDKKTDPEKSNYIQAKVNGALWSPTSVTCILLNDTTFDFRLVNFSASTGGKLITIEASDNANGGTINTGTRTFSSGSAYFGFNMSGTPYRTLSGKINIETVEASSQQVSGSFDFIVEDDSGNRITVSDGRFVKVSYSLKVQ